jgi:hypothetical protein
MRLKRGKTEAQRSKTADERAMVRCRVTRETRSDREKAKMKRGDEVLRKQNMATFEERLIR